MDRENLKTVGKAIVTIAGMITLGCIVDSVCGIFTKKPDIHDDSISNYYTTNNYYTLEDEEKPKEDKA